MKRKKEEKEIEKQQIYSLEAAMVVCFEPSIDRANREIASPVIIGRFNGDPLEVPIVLASFEIASPVITGLECGVR